MSGASQDSDEPEQADDSPFRDAEAWLDEQGIERRRIQVDPTGDDGGSGRDSRPERPPPPGDRPGSRNRGPDSRDPGEQADADAAGQAGPARLEDEVAEAVAFVRRSTTQSPQSEQRLADKLAENGYSDVVVETALQRSRAQGLVDDEALAASFVDERRRKAHARSRIGKDLRKRGFDSATIERALSDIDDQDEEAAALEIARKRAERMSDEDTETVFRRVVGYLARRGYAEGLSRKVARKALFDG